MNDIFLQIRSNFNQFSSAEKKIAEWLLKSTSDTLPSKITDLAEKSGCSISTIVRFSKKMGCSGYAELKLLLARESREEKISIDLEEDDSVYSIFEKLCSQQFVCLERTKKILKAENLAMAVKKISLSKRTLVIGLGSSAAVAIEAANKLMRAGCNAVAYSDTHMQAIAVGQLNENDTVIGISHSGRSKDIVECLKLARQNGVCTVAITSKDRSPLAKEADILLLTDTEDSSKNISGLNSHLSRILMIDALCYKLLFKNSQSKRDVERIWEEELKSKRTAE